MSVFGYKPSYGGPGPALGQAPMGVPMPPKTGPGQGVADTRGWQTGDAQPWENAPLPGPATVSGGGSTEFISYGAGDNPLSRALGQEFNFSAYGGMAEGPFRFNYRTNPEGLQRQIQSMTDEQIRALDARSGSLQNALRNANQYYLDRYESQPGFTQTPEQSQRVLAQAWDTYRQRANELGLS